MTLFTEIIKLTSENGTLTIDFQSTNQNYQTPYILQTSDIELHFKIFIECIKNIEHQNSQMMFLQ